MRCKPGDLAFYVGVDQRDLGKIVLVVGPLLVLADETIWVVDPPLRKLNQSDFAAGVHDSALTPIRGDGLKDESVTDVIKEQTCEHQ